MTFRTRSKTVLHTTATATFCLAEDCTTGEPVTLAVWKNAVSLQAQQVMQKQLAPWQSVWHPTLVNVRGLELHEGVPFLVLDALPENARRLTKESRLDAMEVQRLALAALVALEALRQGGIRHGKICPGAFVTGSDGWLLLPDLAVDTSQDSDCNRPPQLSPWSPWYWINRLGQLGNATSSNDPQREQEASLAKQDLVALARTLCFAMTGTDRIERKPWKSVCPDLNPVIAKVLDDVARGRGPASTEQFRIAMMGQGAKLALPQQRPELPSTICGKYVLRHPDWVWMVPRLREMLDALGLKHIDLSIGAGTDTEFIEDVLRVGDWETRPFDEYVGFSLAASEVGRHPDLHYTFHPRAQSELLSFQQIPVVTRITNHRWQLQTGYDGGMIDRGVFATPEALLDELEGHITAIFGGEQGPRTRTSKKDQSMSQWETNPKLHRLNEFCQRCRVDPGAATDAEFVEFIKTCHWPASASDYADASFAIIAEALCVRPYLARELIAMPIGALVSCGMWEDDDWRKMIQCGIDCANSVDAYVRPTAAGKIWLQREWPKLEVLIEDVFHSTVSEA